MRRYHFDLVHINSVTDVHGAILDNDAHATKIARQLAHEVREGRPELIGKGYEILIRTENGHEVSRIALDRPADAGNGF